MTLLITEFTYKWLYFYNSTWKHICNVTFINVISEVVITKVFISIVVVSSGHWYETEDCIREY